MKTLIPTAFRYLTRSSRIFNIVILFFFTTLLYGQLDPGQIGSNQSLCYGYAPGRLYFTSAPTGGVLPYSYRWQRSNDLGTTWVDITGTSASQVTYSPPVLSRTTMFRCRVTDATPSSDVTNTVTITVMAPLSAGTIGTAQTLDFDELPAPLTQTQAPSGGDGVYSFRWQSSVDGLLWSDIQGGTSQGYTPAQMFTNTWFRRFVSDGSCGSSAGNTVKITVNPITLFTTEIPTTQSNDNRYNLSTEFRVLADGFITHVRLFSHLNEGGLHLIRIYRQLDDMNYELLAGPFEWDFTAGTHGWRDFKLASAIEVEGDRNYVVSITNGLNNNWYVQSNTSFNTVADNAYLDYLNSYYGSVDELPTGNYGGATYFRDVVFVPYSAGSVGSSQSICFNNTPSPINEITAPAGGSGIFRFQWQSSIDSINWTNIQGASSTGYSPGVLTQTTYFRRLASSGGLEAASIPVTVTVNPQFNSASLAGPDTVQKGSSTTFTLNISGGTPPYTIEYECNNIPQPQVVTSSTSNNINTGILVTGRYVFNITSVTDSRGCTPETIGGNITITATESGLSTRSNDALLIVNSGSAYFQDFTMYTQAYMDWFGIPYETCDVNDMVLPVLSDYGLIILGHRNVYSSDYPISNFEDAVSSGSGLYSLDPHLFDYASSFNVSGSTPEVISHEIDIITSPEHYITELHVNDSFNPTNNSITLLVVNNVPVTITINQSDYTLAGGVNLATMSSGASTAPLLQVASYGDGRIVRWNSYNWMFDEPLVLGPVFGMDDLLWRSIVWAARKPFVFQGLPPMITMRVDDVDGYGTPLETDLEWLKISNEYGFIPWCGTFIDSQTPTFYTTLKSLVDNNLATASPHAFSSDDFIFYNQNNLPVFDAAQNVIDAWDTYAAHSVPASKYVVAHWYLITADAVSAMHNEGVEFLGTHIPYDPVPYPGNWLNCGPYRILRNGWAGRGSQPLYYGGYVNWLGNEFFVSLTEIQDDGGYDWVPSDDVTASAAMGIRHLRRALNSMVLPCLFMHEYYLDVTISNWRQILSSITTEIASYNPEYKSMDDAATYVRAKENLTISSVRVEGNNIYINAYGNNDMDTRCYLFTETGNVISDSLVTLPQISTGDGTITVIVAN